MRVYNVFMINNHFSKLYKNKPRTLYQMLEQISKVNEKDYMFAFKLFEQIALPFNRDDLYSFLEKNDDKYLKVSEDTYILSDTYSKEVTKIIVGAAHIKIVSNKNNPEIFKVLKKYSEFLYVCDFDNSDYFWLDKIIIKEEN